MGFQIHEFGVCDEARGLIGLPAVLLACVDSNGDASTAADASISNSADAGAGAFAFAGTGTGSGDDDGPPRYWTNAQAPLRLLTRKLVAGRLTPTIAVRLVALSFEQLATEALTADVPIDGADELIPVYSYALAHAIAAPPPRGLHRPWAVVRLVDEAVDAGEFDFDDLGDGGEAEQRFTIFRSVLEYIERAGF